MTWTGMAQRLIAEDGACVLVTVAALRGSAPREIGAKMLVARHGVHGSVGGGHLEFRATEEARRLLDERAGQGSCMIEFPLGPALGQCCGGSVQLLFERLSAESLPWLARWREAAAEGTFGVAVARIGPEVGPRLVLGEGDLDRAALPAAVAEQARRILAGMAGASLSETAGPEAYLLEPIAPPVDRLYLFGAGHVGQAVVQALAPLPFRITWIDARAEIFPEAVPDNVEPCVAAQPKFEADRAAPGSLFLVMTHSHPLDLEICARVLRRGDFAFLGLIGSDTKRAKFTRRLRARGLSDGLIARLTCPIGIAGITGKQPAVIAAAVAAQLLAVAEATRLRCAVPDSETAPLVSAAGRED